MKISTDGQENYTNHYQNCCNVQLPSQYILSYPEIQARIFKISPEDPKYLIFSDKAVEFIEAVFYSFGAIYKAPGFYQFAQHCHSTTNSSS
ncbi:hypothetical protein TNCV_425091 [Trichonephila clavipes]|nr:hypothetical protein TNCV_425091 [Trichonephila clavipes]